MKEVKIFDISPADAMDIVRELRQQGLLQGKDFDFAYYQASWDQFSHEAVSNKHVKFSFYNEKYATFFILKYVK